MSIMSMYITTITACVSAFLVHCCLCTRFEAGLCQHFYTVCVATSDFESNCTCLLFADSKHRKFVFYPPTSQPSTTANPFGFAAVPGSAGQPAAAQPNPFAFGNIPTIVVATTKAPESRGRKRWRPETSSVVTTTDTSTTITTTNPFLLRSDDDTIAIADLDSYRLSAFERNTLDRSFARYYTAALEEPLARRIFHDKMFKEHIQLFAVNETEWPDVVDFLTDNETDSEHAGAFNGKAVVDLRRCVDTSLICHHYSTSRIGYNRSANSYSFSTQLMHGMRMDKPREDMYLFAYSTVHSTFAVGYVRKRVCAHQCKPLRQMDQPLCMRTCHHGYQDRYMSLTGRMLQQWKNYIHGLAVANFRLRYGIYFPQFPQHPH